MKTKGRGIVVVERESERDGRWRSPFWHGTHVEWEREQVEHGTVVQIADIALKQSSINNTI